MKGTVQATAKIMKIRHVQRNINGNGGANYSGTMMLEAGEQWIPTMVATHGSTHAGYVDTYTGDTGGFSVWFTDMVPESTVISVHGFAFKSE